MNRRIFLQSSLGGLTTGLHSIRLLAEQDQIEALRDDWRRYVAPSADIAESGSTISHTDDEWRDLLSEEQYAVLREQATEEPFSSPLNDETRPGIYCCAGCDLPLFSSAMKYDSGTGWPSFFTTIPGAFETQRDFAFLIPRTEYHCSRCAGHHGHVFGDGPDPTGERWCNNGVALRFIPRNS